MAMLQPWRQPTQPRLYNQAADALLLFVGRYVHKGQEVKSRAISRR